MLDFKKITEVAIENILQYGQLMPMLAVETTRETVYYGLAEFGALDKKLEMYLMGRRSCEEQKGRLISVTFACEAWLLKRKNYDDLPKGSFEDEPDRIEVVIVTQYKTQNKETTGAIYEMLRKGDALDLVESDISDAIAIESYLFEAFLKGFQHG